MQFIYDNLTASVISGTVLLILFTVQMRATSSSIAQTGRNFALNRAQTFATWLEQDLQRVGRNRSNDEEIFSGLNRVNAEESRSPTGKTLSTEGGSAFTFYFGSGKTAVTYDVSARQKTIAGEQRTVYQLTRSPDGRSPSNLGYIDIQFIDENAKVIDNPETAWKNSPSRFQAIRVHFSIIPPFQNEESALKEVHRMVVVPFTPSL